MDRSTLIMCLYPRQKARIGSLRYRKESDGNRVTITHYYCNLVRRRSARSKE